MTSNWNLVGYNIRYFYEETDPAKLLKNVRRFVKDNPDISLTAVDINRDTGRDNADRWTALVTYYGTLTEEN